MGLFRTRSSAPMLPTNTVAMMERFGEFDFDPQASSDDAMAIWPEPQQPLSQFASSDPDGFVCALAAAVLPVGGWVVYGAAHTLSNLVNTPPEDDTAYNAFMNASLVFLRERGVWQMRLTGNEWKHWLSQGGTSETW